MENDRKWNIVFLKCKPSGKHLEFNKYIKKLCKPKNCQ